MRFSFVLMLASLLALPFIALAQNGGVRGKISSSEGETLPFASIFVKENATGISANTEGRYEIRLAPGRYTLYFQYLSFQTQVREVTVGEDFQTVDVVLTPQAIMLQEQTVSSRREDPAYTIMRKAIAKSDYHRKQVDAYTARVYIKGAGVIKKIPFLFKKMLEKEGVDENTVYLTESITDVSYTRPDKYDEKVISLRSSGEEGASPNEYLKVSMYEPMIGPVVSPLSPKAFAYYRFEYTGSFQDRGLEIDKIKVIPRSKGTSLFSGDLYIVDGLWCIHSLDLGAMVQGFQGRIKKIYGPVADNCWMPLTQKFDVGGSVWGFDVEYNYVSTTSAYQVRLNPDLAVPVEVIDEKIEKELAKEVAKKELAKPTTKTQNNAPIFDSEQQMTRKQMRQMMKEYEKAEWEQRDSAQYVVQETNLKVDSLAEKRTTEYWAEIRPIPLTEMETQSYLKRDSVILAKKEKAEKDSVKAEKDKKWRFTSILTGHTFKTGKRSSLEWVNPLQGVQFNTVDGWNMNLKMRYTLRPDSTNTYKRLQVTPTYRYNFDREAHNGKLNATYRFGKETRRQQLVLEGGRFVSQLNEANPIPFALNTMMTTIFEKNLAKIFEKDYLQMGYTGKIGRGLELTAKAEYAQRMRLENSTDRVFIDSRKRAYTPNLPVLSEAFVLPAEQEVITSTLGFSYRPLLRYGMRNGRKYEIGRGPIFNLQYKKGFLDADFDQLELGAQHTISLGLLGQLDWAAKAGAFLNDRQLFLQDFRHFQGNLTPLVYTDLLTGFRLLDYYAYSTSEPYFEAHVRHQFRKLLLTRILFVRMAGFSEDISLHYLATSASRNYFEASYALDGIFRIFRIEGIASFQDGRYLDFGVRLGVTANISFE